MRPDSERICFAKQSEQWTSSPRSVMSGGVFNRKTPEIGKDFSSEKSSRTDHSPKGCALRSKVCFSPPLLKQSPRNSPLSPHLFFAILLQTFGQDRRTR